MVSGTPLYSKISDLQGELNFLRVSPFGAGHEDGFWRHVIGAPWQASDDSALDALQVLLHGVMMRHSKTQTWMDGTTILALPRHEEGGRARQPPRGLFCRRHRRRLA